ncbi:MAG TPA: hypothetical protein PKY05_00215 [Fibrobacteria bacterium]|nr:hypothetical protein [Fibrobacteria bacterium]
MPLSVTPANPWVKGLYPGTHTAMNGTKITFTDADVSAHVDSVRKQLVGGYMPPLVTGHPKHDDPRVGSVVDVKLDGSVSWYKVDHLSPAFAEACQRGEFIYSSPKLNADGTLRHLGALGAWNPSLKDQPPFAFGEAGGAEEDDGHLAFGISEDWGIITGRWLNRLARPLQALGRLLRGQREALIEAKGIEVADKQLPSYEIESLEKIEIPWDIAPPEDKAAPAFAAPAAQASVAAQGAPATTEREVSLQAELDTARRRLTEIAISQAGAAFGAQLDKASEAGRLSPVLRAKFEALHKELTAASHDGALAFGEADPIPALLGQLLDTLPKVVEFGESFVGGKPPVPPLHSLVADAKARAAQFHKETR